MPSLVVIGQQIKEKQRRHNIYGFMVPKYPSLNRVKGELDCFNCKAEGFLRLFTLMFSKKKSTRLWGLFNNYKEVKS